MSVSRDYLDNHGLYLKIGCSFNPQSGDMPNSSGGSSYLAGNQPRVLKELQNPSIQSKNEQN
ncbi:hypothetical protein COEREDRAFT_82917, partial [Coemansia reversa NRRL 1564]